MGKESIKNGYSRVRERSEALWGIRERDDAEKLLSRFLTHHSHSRTALKEGENIVNMNYKTIFLDS